MNAGLILSLVGGIVFLSLVYAAIEHFIPMIRLERQKNMNFMELWADNLKMVGIVIVALLLVSFFI